MRAVQVSELQPDDGDENDEDLVSGSLLAVPAKVVVSSAAAPATLAPAVSFFAPTTPASAHSQDESESSRLWHGLLNDQGLTAFAEGGNAGGASATSSLPLPPAL
jgi:hypothetical protein